jgi:hypothetical protein
MIDTGKISACSTEYEVCDSLASLTRKFQKKLQIFKKFQNDKIFKNFQKFSKISVFRKFLNFNILIIILKNDKTIIAYLFPVLQKIIKQV